MGRNVGPNRQDQDRQTSQETDDERETFVLLYPKKSKHPVVRKSKTVVVRSESVGQGKRHEKLLVKARYLTKVLRSNTRLASVSESIVHL